jgi:hypothetical protein
VSAVRSRRRGLRQAGIASKSLRFGAATHAACRPIPTRSGTPRARSRLAGVARRATQREDELRESDGREIGRRRGSQRAWLLARAVMKPEAIAAARRKSGWCERTRTEAAASRGGGSRARTGVPVRRKRTAEVGCSGLGPIEASRDGSLQGGLAWRGQGLAQWEHLTRSKTEREPTTAKRDQRSHRRGVILEVSEIRDEPPPRGARLLPKGSGARIDSDGRRLRANEIGVSVTARRWKGPR